MGGWGRGAETAAGLYSVGVVSKGLLPIKHVTSKILISVNYCTINQLVPTNPILEVGGTYLHEIRWHGCQHGKP